MKEIKVLVVDPVGLHARPATVAVNAASKFKCDVKVAFKDRSVNMKSIMDRHFHMDEIDAMYEKMLKESNDKRKQKTNIIYKKWKILK